MPAALPELACYGLAGHTESPRDLLVECAEAERVGIGSVFLSERFNVKEAASLTGAAAAVTTTLGIATGVTNHNTRHPLVTAAWGATVHRLSGGRFALGIGRGVNVMAGKVVNRPVAESHGMPYTHLSDIVDGVDPSI